MVDDHVWRERHQSTSDVRRRNRRRTTRRPRRVRRFQPQFKPHHEIHPLFLIRGDRGNDRRHLLFASAHSREKPSPLLPFQFPAVPPSRDIPDRVPKRNVPCPSSRPSTRPIPSQSNQLRFPPAPPSPRCAELDATAPVNPAASANGTVNPSDIPMTMSRTAAVAVKCFSTCSTDGILDSLTASNISGCPYPSSPAGAYNYGAGTANQEVHYDRNFYRTRSRSSDDFHTAAFAVCVRRTGTPH